MADHYKALRSNLESRESTSEASLEEPTCFFFNLPSTSEKDALHLIQPFWLDQRVRRCANILHDSIHHAKLQSGGMIAQHAMYHKVCLSNFYRKASAKQLEGHYTDEERKLHGLNDLNDLNWDSYHNLKISLPTKTRRKLYLPSTAT